MLPLGETMRNLPDEEDLTHILTNISGKTCRNGSRVGEIEPVGESSETAGNAASGLELSQSGDSESLVEVAGVEPASREFFKTASTRVVVFMVLSPVQEATPSGPRLPSTV